MNELISSIDWMDLINAIWTIVLVPTFTWVAKQIHDWAKTKQIDKYTDMLADAVSKVVKEMYQTVVDNIKGTEDWTEEKQKEILEIAKTKIIQAITTDGYHILREANTDFEQWLESLIEAAIYDEKHKTLETATQ